MTYVLLIREWTCPVFLRNEKTHRSSKAKWPKPKVPNSRRGEPCHHHTRSLHTLKAQFLFVSIREKSRKMANESTATCIDIILAIILPPLGVFFKYGCKIEFWICLLLTFFGYLPGIIYAVWVITK
ncbi:Low temperature and salt responsive protein [Rhynchospora pubera]|uniref:Low temperature and salt responsive protein n=1 Tax=Rhynchospora pubera TaxID=906938 RepID=A0AAV8D9S5_9POAL|nr:Low temperature and salt responsive protein [Rhynchospora pubera]